MSVPTPPPTPLPTAKSAANQLLHCAHAAHAAMRVGARENARTMKRARISRVYICAVGGVGLVGISG